MEITYNGYYYINRLTDAMRSRLTIKENPTRGRPKHFAVAEYKAYKYLPRTDNYVIPSNIAQTLISSGAATLKNPDATTPNAYVDYPPLLQLFESQLIAARYIYKHFKGAPIPNTFYLDMPTGEGKTRVGIAVAMMLGLRALFVVPSTPIAESHKEEITRANMDCRIYKNGEDLIAEHITIIIINTLREKPIQFMDNFGIIIFDETHEYYSRVNSNALWMIGRRFALGLSASPLEREDGMDHAVIFHLGRPVKAATIPHYVVDDVHFDVSVRVIKYSGTTEAQLSAAGTMSAVLTIGKFAEDGARTDLICRTVSELRDSGNTGIFIFSETRDYLDIISARLMALDKESEIFIEDGQTILRGGIKKETLHAAKTRGAHIVLTTYGYSRRGVSLPVMTAMILATPRRNGLNQIVGRILRRGSDYSIPRVVVDIVDVAAGFAGQYRTRRAFYKMRGYIIHSDVFEAEDEKITMQELMEMIQE